jgi:hypothetical protein|tara:strand:+ start:2449 stop:2625 length:177 start_codon:yes stop_codon:yes gene_type:complete
MKIYKSVSVPEDTYNNIQEIRKNSTVVALSNAQMITLAINKLKDIINAKEKSQNTFKT